MKEWTIADRYFHQAGPLPGEPRYTEELEEVLTVQEQAIMICQVLASNQDEPGINTIFPSPWDVVAESLGYSTEAASLACSAWEESLDWDQDSLDDDIQAEELLRSGWVPA